MKEEESLLREALAVHQVFFWGGWGATSSSAEARAPILELERLTPILELERLARARILELERVA